MEIRGYTVSEYVSRFFLPRKADSHKGDYGRVLVAAGSFGMAGACSFAAKSALKTGSGLVMILTPDCNVPVLQVLCPEAICLRRDAAFGKLADFDAVAAGSGMGKTGKAAEILERLINECASTLVLDADGLNMIAENPRLGRMVMERASDGLRTIITPHMGEAARLLGEESLKDADRADVCRRLVEKYGAVTVLKGHGTCVAAGDDIWINTTGNPGMATAGSGDALTGIIASLAGQGLEAEDAARAGVYLHGLAGDIAAGITGEYSLTVTDITDRLPDAIRRVSTAVMQLD